MPTLYCAAHGRDRENGTIAEQDVYREAGESVLVVTGKLKTGPWRCDRCNATLRQDDEATLVSAFPRQVTQSLFDYDFGHERRYFAMRGDEAIAVYGRPWPGGDVVAMLGRAG